MSSHPRPYWNYRNAIVIVAIVVPFVIGAGHIYANPFITLIFFAMSVIVLAYVLTKGLTDTPMRGKAVITYVTLGIIGLILVGAAEGVRREQREAFIPHTTNNVTNTPIGETPPIDLSGLPTDSVLKILDEITERDLRDAAKTRNMVARPTTNPPISKEEARKLAKEVLDQSLDNKMREIEEEHFVGNVFTPLVVMVKETLADPDAFEEVNTVHYREDGYMIVAMRFRAKNAFNAYVINTVVAKIDIMTNQMVDFKYLNK